MCSNFFYYSIFSVQVIIVASRNLVTDPLRQLANVSIELEEVMQQCLINHGSSECNSGIGSNQSGLSMSQHELDFDNDTNARSKDNTSDYKEEEIGNFVSSYHNRYEEHPIASLSNEYIQEVPVTGSQRPLCDTHSTTMSNMDVRSYVPASPHANQEHLELLEKLKQYQQTLQGSQTNELLNENFNMKSHIDNSSGVYSANNQVVGGNGGKINLINVSAPHSVVSRTSGYESNTGLSAIPSHLSGVSMHSSIDASGGSQAGLGTSRLCHPGTDEAVMYRDLEVSLKICNVRLAVSTLRKIYTRQSRLFKIPEILNELMHARLLSSVNREHSDKAIILFILSCIQWCFGIQNGEHVDSFKYKMNKNIASWLLQSISHMHHFGSPASSEIVNSAQAVVRHILESVAELDFCLEILQTFAIENAHEILRSYVTFWINSDNPVLSAKSREFAIMHGHPTTPTSSEVNMSSVPTALDGAAANIVVSAGVGIQQNGHTCVAGGVKTLERMSAEQLIALPLSKLTPDQKLFVLVARAPEGLLGARIPSLYRETFGERLRLQGRKLKDVILSKFVLFVF